MDPRARRAQPEWAGAKGPVYMTIRRPAAIGLVAVCILLQPGVAQANGSQAPPTSIAVTPVDPSTINVFGATDADTPGVTPGPSGVPAARPAAPPIDPALVPPMCPPGFT